MNKYEILFNDIFQQTKNNSLRWRQVPRNTNAELIFNPHLVFRQFSADFPRSGGRFKLFLLEKKYADPEYGFAYEKYVPEILIVDDQDELVTTLTDAVIEHKDMTRLADMVETRNDNAAKLFAAGS